MIWKVPHIPSMMPITSALERFFSRCKSLVVAKGNEYSVASDRLSNFRDGMHLTGLPADVYLLSLMAKHVLWFYTEAKKEDPPDKDAFIEHACDIIMYLALLFCMYYTDSDSLFAQASPEQRGSES